MKLISYKVENNNIFLTVKPPPETFLGFVMHNPLNKQFVSDGGNFWFHYPSLEPCSNLEEVALSRLWAAAKIKESLKS
jgi:hypothetical protein